MPSRRSWSARKRRHVSFRSGPGSYSPLGRPLQSYYQPTLVVAGWATSIADYERRGSQTPTPAGFIDSGTKTRTGAVQGGLDFTWNRPSFSWLDQMVLGVVASRSSSSIDINFGASGHLEGWGVGAYWMGVTGPWSLDVVTKLDYFNYTPTGGLAPVPGIPSDFFITNYTGAGNLNYRIPMGWTSLEAGPGESETSTLRRMCSSATTIFSMKLPRALHCSTTMGRPMRA